MENKELTKSYAYFAAANGYSGFRSYFNNVFNPTKFLRLFILKGGPGTGKNTLMKSVNEEFIQCVEASELIYCSSDTSSLDGVILKSKKGLVGIIDGTAPHATDPKYPGCIDEIINLGQFWNADELSKKRDIIEAITRKKSEAYSRAYTFLNLAGKCTEAIDDILQDAYKDSEIICRRSTCTHRGKLIDSFCKDGLSEVNTLSRLAKKTVGIVGLWGSDQLYIKRLSSMYSSDDVVEFPSALSDSKIKAVYIKSENTAYISNPCEGTDYTETLDVSDLLDYEKIKLNSSYLERLSGIRESLLWNSTDEFKNASEAHFMLEDIYKSAMDFSAFDTIKDDLYSKIKNILL